MFVLATLLVLGCTIDNVVAQQAQFVDPMRAYTIELPEKWRQLTPDEWRTVRDMMSADVSGRLIPTVIDRFGDIDGWLEKGFDGRCLTVTREENEPAMNEAMLDEVRLLARERSTGNLRYELSNLAIGAVGRKDNPAITCILRLSDSSGRPLGSALEFIVPTGGKTLRFSYRATPEDFAAALPVFRKSAASLEIARPAEGRKELTDILKMPLIIGAVVGLVFLVLYKMRKG